MTNPDDLIANARATVAAMRHQPTTKKRKGPTPEAKVGAAVDRYLASLTPRPIVTRANAGSWQDESGHYIQGAKAGTNDKICLFEGGFWVGIETKSATGTQSDSQRRFQARVEALGGLYILARSAGDARAALVERFGEERVREWEGVRR